MHEPVDRTLGVVANRVVALGGIADELTRIGHELTCDRIGGIFGLDELGQRRGEPDRVAPGDGFELLKPLRRGKPRLHESFGSRQAAGSVS